MKSAQSNLETANIQLEGKIMVEREQHLKTRMQFLSESSLDLILRMSASGDIYYANPIVEDYTDIAPHTLMNRNLTK